MKRHLNRLNRECRHIRFERVLPHSFHGDLNQNSRERKHMTEQVNFALSRLYYQMFSQNKAIKPLLETKDIFTKILKQKTFFQNVLELNQNKYFHVFAFALWNNVNVYCDELWRGVKNDINSVVQQKTTNRFPRT